MDDVIWWIGVFHVIVYIVVGTTWAATYLMWRALRYLGLWSQVFQGLKEKADRKRTENAG